MCLLFFLPITTCFRNLPGMYFIYSLLPVTALLRALLALSWASSTLASLPSRLVPVKYILQYHQSDPTKRLSHPLVTTYWKLSQITRLPSSQALLFLVLASSPVWSLTTLTWTLRSSTELGTDSGRCQAVLDPGNCSCCPFSLENSLSHPSSNSCIF